MRFRKKRNGLTINAITGTTCVLLSFDLTASKRNSLLGFAIEREDKTEKEKYFLKGFKFFEEFESTRVEGQLFSTFEQPIQSFLWEDFSVKEKHTYVYRVIPVYGKPKFLEYGKDCKLEVNTPENEAGEHSVYFNRGVAGSNAYATKFHNQKPSEMTPAKKEEALKWLSRGLFEALIGFIEKAKDQTFSIRASLYEFEHQPVLEAFKSADAKGVNVKIIYDSRGQKVKNEEAIHDAHMPQSMVIARTRDAAYISHNKFIILLEKNIPIAVWTGSTNITEKGIFGQCNTGHVIRNQQIGEKYLEYWELLATDPMKEDLKKKSVEIEKDMLKSEIPIGTSVIFSPRTRKKILDTYAGLLAESNQLICGMFPFSFYKGMKEEIIKSTEHLKYVLIDKQDKNTTLLSNDFDNVIVYGGYFDEPLFNWLKEKSAGGLFKSGTNFIHNKILLIDPFSADPIIVIGSANFSENSILRNDENTLIIRGNTDLADMYLTEYVRVFNHYYVRQIAKKMASPGSRNPLWLYEDSNKWLPTFFKNTTLKGKRKKLFDEMYLKPAV